MMTPVRLDLRRNAALALSLWLCGFFPLLPLVAVAQDSAVVEPSLPRHPLEERALAEPEAVLTLLPARIDEARARGDSQELALLLLAQANACRVIADWPCQRLAGAEAARAAESAGKKLLLLRALIAESRALIAMQDFTRGEQLLGRAELLLKATPNPELAADVFLAYSSLSYSLGKHALSADYASRGLAVLSKEAALPTQARLLRNLARARSQLGQMAEADRALLDAGMLAERFNDPKLSAELLLESARVARTTGDAAAQQRNGERVLELARRLKNSQLAGLGREVLGLAAIDRGDGTAASRELHTAYESFRALGLKRDEARVLRELIRVAIDQGQPHTVTDPLVTRFLTIDGALEISDRAKAADDFDARLKYAEREMDVLRLKDEAALSAERERVLALGNRQSQVLIALGLFSLLVLAVFFVLQRRSNQRLTTALALLRESEAQARDLLNLSPGFVFLHDVHGRLVLVNPATAHALGRSAEALVGEPLQGFQPRGNDEVFNSYLARVLAAGVDEGVLLVRSGDGDHRHWRYSSRLSAPHNGRAYVVGNAVDVTDQVHQTHALHEQSVRDALTGCYNRRHLETFELAHRPGESWATIAVDLDHFKQVNDTLGHDRGDQVLIEFGQFLAERVRAEDSVVRIGGDEFVVLLHGADAESLQATTRRLQQDAALAPCGFSIGSALREADESLASTIASADAAMYASRAVRRAVSPSA